MNDVVLWRRLAAEYLGSAFLAAIVVGSGIAAQQLSPGNHGLELLQNAIVTQHPTVLVKPCRPGALAPTVRRYWTRQDHLMEDAYPDEVRHSAG